MKPEEMITSGNVSRGTEESAERRCEGEFRVFRTSDFTFRDIDSDPSTPDT